MGIIVNCSSKLHDWCCRSLSAGCARLSHLNTPTLIFSKGTQRLCIYYDFLAGYGTSFFCNWICDHYKNLHFMDFKRHFVNIVLKSAYYLFVYFNNLGRYNQNVAMSSWFINYSIKRKLPNSNFESQLIIKLKRCSLLPGSQVIFVPFLCFI